MKKIDCVHKFPREKITILLTIEEGGIAERDGDELREVERKREIQRDIYIYIKLERRNEMGNDRNQEWEMRMERVGL